MRPVLIVASVLAVTCLGSDAWAPGLYLYELGTPDVGLASAGYTTRAGDAGTYQNRYANFIALNGNWEF